MNSVHHSDTAGKAVEQYWSTELEELHEESSRSHFLDVWTRQAILDSLGAVPRDGPIVDLGSSSGYLLEDLKAIVPEERLIGLDFLYTGLHVARTNLPIAGLVEADACLLPLQDSCAAAIVSANLLEHVPDDLRALREMHRVIAPRSRVVLVVPAAPQCYDYYDRYLHHQRRYARSELANKAASVGFDVLHTFHIGWTIYPVFWLVKKRNRLLYDDLRGKALAQRVARDIAKTKDSKLGHVTRRLERSTIRRRVCPHFGVREVCVLQRRG